MTWIGDEAFDAIDLDRQLHAGCRSGGAARPVSAVEIELVFRDVAFHLFIEREVRVARGLCRRR